MRLTIGDKSFKCLIDTGAERTVLRQEEVPPSWKLVPGPPLLGVGGQSSSYETANPLRWVDPDGNRGQICPLVAPGLTANLLGQDILGATEAFITTDHKAFFDDVLDEEEYQQQFQEVRDSHPNYREDPYLESIRQRYESPQS